MEEGNLYRLIDYSQKECPSTGIYLAWVDVNSTIKCSFWHERVAFQSVGVRAAILDF